MKTKIIPFYNPTERLLVKSQDCRQYDSEGREYIDFESGVWCAGVGHCHERIKKLITSMAGESIHHGYKFSNEYAERLSAELLSLTGIMEGGSVFLSSGSEAVNLAITLARQLTGRSKILKIDNSYLSAFGFGMVSAGNDYIRNIRYNDFDAIAEIDFSDISAFVVETGGASIDMVRFPDLDFIKTITENSLKKGCIIIADEVTTGMGRTGRWFGYEHYDITPDIVVTGKGLGNGYPVSAVTINSGIVRRFTGNSFRYAQSHQNDPLGCAIALEVINIIREENLVEKSLTTGEYFIERLKSVASRLPGRIKEIRGRGLLIGLEFTVETDGELVSGKLFEKGFVTGYKSGTLRFLPPLTIKRDDIDKLAGSLEDILINM